MKRGKNYKKVTQNLDRSKTYSLEEAIKKVKSLSYSKFTGTLELHIATVISKDKDPKSIKGSVSLPHSTESKSVKVAVFTTPDRDKKSNRGRSRYSWLGKINEGC